MLNKERAKLINQLRVVNFILSVAFGVLFLRDGNSIAFSVVATVVLLYASIVNHQAVVLFTYILTFLCILFLFR